MDFHSPIFYNAAQKTDIQHCISIVSHNAFWFQGVPFATDKPPAPRLEILNQLCALYTEICADVLCLQEIQSEETARAVAEELEMNYIFRPGGSYPQYGGAVFCRWPMVEVPLPQGETPDRILIQAQISPENASSFRLVNAHLPSSRQRGAEGSQQQRLKEVSLVIDQADVILGDFNETPDGQCATLLQSTGFVDAAHACSAGEVQSNFWSYRGDQIWLSAEMANMLQSYFVVPKERLALCDGEKTSLSDHLPIGCLLG